MLALIKEVKAPLIASLLISAEEDKAVIADALELIFPALVDTSDAIEAFAIAAELLNDVTLDSIFVCLALEEVTYPANAWSFDVSTLLIRSTISANVSVSATDADKIASILSFSVPILPSKEDSIALRWLWAELLNAVSAEA